MRQRRLLVLLLLPPLLAAQPSPAQAFLQVRVVSAESMMPLPNVEVSAPEVGVRRLTDERGVARFEWPARRALHLRLRQLGYRSREQEVKASGAALDTVTLALERLPIPLQAVRTEWEKPCVATADTGESRLLLYALEQLRLAGDHYEQFKRVYPFDIVAERRTVTIPRGRGTRRATVAEERESAERWGDPYRPGEVVHRDNLGYSVSLIFLGALADTLFWDNHCFAARGVEDRPEGRALRIDFSPTASITSEDWQGTAWIDSATSVLRRIEFRLVGVADGERPRRLEGYTTFRLVSPFITVPDSNVAMFWVRDPADSAAWGLPDRVQLLRLKELRYRSGVPPVMP